MLMKIKSGDDNTCSIYKALDKGDSLAAQTTESKPLKEAGFDACSTHHAHVVSELSTQ